MPKLLPKLTTTTEALRQLIAEYNIKPGLDEVDDFSSKAFNQYTTDRVQHISQLKTAKTPAGDLISEKLSKPNDSNKADADALTASLNEIFTPSNELKTAKTEYEEASSYFQAFVKSLPKTKKDISSLYSLLKDPIDSGIIAITNQQKKEIEGLDTKLKENNDKLMSLLGVTADQLDTVKSNIKKDVETLHKAQLDAFKKATEDSIQKLLNASEKHMEERFFIANMYKNGSLETRREIEKIAIENRQKAGENIATSVSVSPDSVEISSVNLKSLQFIQRLNGMRITNDDPLVYKINMGWKIRSPLYYLLDRDKKDLLALAQIVRASGAKTILMTPRSDSLKDARAAYEACIKSGYLPSEITIEHPRGTGNYLTAEKMEKAKINGKEFKTESIREVLYKDRPSEFKNLEKLSASIVNELKDIKKFKPENAPKKSPIASDYKDFIAAEKAKALSVASATPENNPEQLTPGHGT